MSSTSGLTFATTTTKTKPTPAAPSIQVTADGTSSVSFPPVVLDTTLYDLLRDEGLGNETACHLKPNSDPSFGEAVPLSRKYIIHSAQVGTRDDLAHLDLEICSYLLNFWMGPMNVMFLAADGQSDDPSLSQQAVEVSANKSFAVIQENQRPRVKTYANVEDFVRNHDSSPMRFAFAMDFAERVKNVFDPELIYKVNSKRWLATCELKGANDEILDTVINCPGHGKGSKDWYYIGPSCGHCDAGVRGEIQRVRNAIGRRSLPFVLKLTQSLSSIGTNIVKTEAQRDDLIRRVTDMLGEYLVRVTEDNAHLYTMSLVISDFLPGPTMALNFHLRKDGKVVFLGACHQMATGESGRQATAITYADQEKLDKKYRGILQDIGSLLHKEGYYGPVGTDIMEDPKTGNLFAIDFNVRTPLSLLLYLLKGHLSTRGYGMSIVYECTFLKVPREELENRFRNEFEEARVILLGSTRMGRKDVWAYGMVVAGEGKEQIDDLSDRLFQFEIDPGVED